MRSRLIGLQANGSSKSPEELVLLNELDSDDPNSWAKEMIELHFDSNLKILGGCCGTNHLHIQKIAEIFMEKKN